MATVIFDTHVAVTDLKQAGFEDIQAEAIVSVIKNSQAELATKRDLTDLKKDLIIWLGAIIFASFSLFSGLIAYIVK